MRGLACAQAHFRRTTFRDTHGNSPLFKFDLIQRVPPQVAARRLALTRTLVPIAAADGTQTLAVGPAERSLREFEDNIFADVGGQVYEVLSTKFLVKHKLLDTQRFFDCFQTPAATQRGGRV